MTFKVFTVSIKDISIDLTCTNFLVMTNVALDLMCAFVASCTRHISIVKYGLVTSIRLNEMKIEFDWFLFTNTFQHFDVAHLFD